MKSILYSTIVVLISISDGLSQFQPRMGSINGTLELGDTLVFSAEIKKPGTWPAEVKARQAGKDLVLYKAGEATGVTIGNDTYDALRVEMDDGSHVYYFVEELSHGKASLYHSKRGKYRFYVKTDQPEGIKRENYRQLISDLAGPFANSYCNHQKTVFTKSSLAYFFERYNEDALNAHFPMPFVTAGIQYNFLSFLLPESSYQTLKINSRTLESSFYSPVVSAHFPFYTNRFLGADIRLANLSGNSMATFGEIETDNYIQDVLIDFSMLQLDAALRYTYSWKKVEPYIAVGLSGIYSLDFSDKVAFFQVQDNIFTTTYFENYQKRPEWFAGINLNQGVKYYFLPRNFIAAEWGYGRYIELTGSDYQISNLFFNVSINFWPW